jgi:hypothetical protein
VSPDQRGDGGIPHTRRAVSLPPGAARREETWQGANEEKDEKLLVRSLKRQAGAQRLQLRHSDHGYALVDTAHKRVHDRSDLTLREVESWLGRLEPAS